MYSPAAAALPSLLRTDRPRCRKQQAANVLGITVTLLELAAKIATSDKLSKVVGCEEKK